MSETEQFWQYAKEAMLSACDAKADEDKAGLLELARTWTQAALQERESCSRSRQPVAIHTGLEVIWGMSVGTSVASVAGQRSLPHQERGQL